MSRIRAKESVRVSFGLSNSTNPPTIWVGILRVSTVPLLWQERRCFWYQRVCPSLKSCSTGSYGSHLKRDLLAFTQMHP